MKTCIWCGKEFEPSKYAPFTLNCSKECSIKYNGRKAVLEGRKREYSRKWREKYAEEKKAMDTRYHNQTRFGGLKYEVLERDDYKCQHCGSDEQRKLIIHHKDENKQNNILDNLITLCRACHALVHHDGNKNTKYKDISKDEIERAIKECATLEDAANRLGITRKTLAKKRRLYGLPQLR